MELFNRVVEGLEKRRERILSGQINCIPFGLERFERELPGIEKRTMYNITASTKVGKTQITDFLFMYNSVFYAFKNPDKIRLKIFYFTLEMSKEQKYQQMLCHFLYISSGGKIRIVPKDLRSTRVDRPLPLEILNIIKSDEYKDFFEFFEKTVIFIDDIRNPTGIYNYCRDYAQANGTQHKITKTFIDNETKEVSHTKELDDYYEPNDPEEYVEIVVDHMALLTPENGGNVRDAMIKMSSKYGILLRNKYNYTLIFVIQQAASQESNENFKMGKLKPTLDGYGDAKVISRDADVIIGLHSPFRHDTPEYYGYDIKEWKDNIRFMELIAGREGGGGNTTPLYFDGGVNYFTELPKPDQIKELNEVLKVAKKARENNILMLMVSYK